MRTPLLIAVSLFLAGCGLPETPAQPGAGSGSERSEIVGGVTDLADPAVVAITVGQGGQFEQFCTGTLVSSKTVVTAAHCIRAYGAQYSYYVNFGTYASQPTKVVKVLNQFAHPQYDPSSGEAHDFGVLELATPVLDVLPIEMNSVALTQAEVGRTIRHSGFGVTSGAQSGAGTKRQVSYSVRQVTAALIESGAQGKQTCNGDSGGPALMVMPGSSAEKLVGVVSFGDQNCNQFGEDGRVDVELSWIKQTMNPWETPTCQTDGKCVPGCAPVDQDCACAADKVCNPDCSDLLMDPDCPRDCGQNGVCALEACPRPDPDCVDEGSACGTAAVCRGRACVNDDQHPQKYCSLPCDPGSTLCPAGMECTAQRVCQLHLKPVVVPGVRCEANSDFCANGTVCAGPADGFSRCVQGCLVTGDCAMNAVCEGGSDGTRFCRPPESELRFHDLILERATAEGSAAPGGCSAVGLGDWSVLGALLGGLSLARRRRA